MQNQIKFSGARLCEAREARALTGSTLSELTGISASSIGRYEKDQQIPRVDSVISLAEALRVPPHYFAPLVYSNEPLLSWRSGSRAKVTQKNRASARFAWLCRCVGVLNTKLEFPAVDLPNLDLPEDPLELSHDQIERSATALRRHWGLQDGPISDLVRLVENKGTVVVRNEMADHLDAFYDVDCLGSGRPYVLLKQDETSACRSRLSLAHEIGHVLLHSHATRDPKRRAELHAILEAQAFHFAGAFLMPAKTFTSEVYSVSPRGLLTIKPRWRVAVSAMIRRLHTLELIGDDKYKKLNIELSRLRWRTVEPLDDEIKVEQPQLIRRAVEVVFDSGRLSRSQYEAEAALYAEDISSVLGLPLSYLSDDATEPYKITFG